MLQETCELPGPSSAGGLFCALQLGTAASVVSMTASSNTPTWNRAVFRKLLGTFASESDLVVRRRKHHAFDHSNHSFDSITDRSVAKLALQLWMGLLSWRRAWAYSYYRNHSGADGPYLKCYNLRGWPNARRFQVFCCRVFFGSYRSRGPFQRAFSSERRNCSLSSGGGASSGIGFLSADLMRGSSDGPRRGEGAFGSSHRRAGTRGDMLSFAIAFALRKLME